MNNTVLKVLAGLLALGSLIVAVLAIKLSQQPKGTTPPTQSASAPTSTELVVIAARQIKAGQAIGAADLQVKGVVSASPQAIRQTRDLLGKTPNSDIPAGTILTLDRFISDGLASQLRVGERGVAVHIDDVLGVGGYLKPGDHVDVLYFLAATKESADTSLAQVTIHNARILTVGDMSQMDIDKARQAAAGSPDALEKNAEATAKEAKERRASQRSTVLAVSEADATRLMLASSTGQLRLALRPQASLQVDPLSIYPANQRTQPSVQTYRIGLADLVQQKAANKGATKPSSGIIIQEGSKERRLTQNDNNTQP
jgi:pilus assembly protein CpaB